MHQSKNNTLHTASVIYYLLVNHFDVVSKLPQPSNAIF